MVLLLKDGVNTSRLVVIKSNGFGLNMTNLVLIVLLMDGAKASQNVNLIKYGSQIIILMQLLVLDGVNIFQFVVTMNTGKWITPTRLLVGVNNGILVLNVLITNIG